MQDRHALLFALCCTLPLALGGCDRNRSASAEVQHTRFPGAVTAGGGTSGEVMARASTAAPKTGGEGTRGQASSPGVAGTPGIPEGAGGTPSGAAMGGTTQGAAGTKNAPQPQEQAAPAQQEKR